MREMNGKFPSGINIKHTVKWISWSDAIFFRPETNAAFEWIDFDVHAVVGKPGKRALVGVLKALDADDRPKLRQQWKAVYPQNG